MRGRACFLNVRGVKEACAVDVSSEALTAGGGWICSGIHFDVVSLVEYRLDLLRLELERCGLASGCLWKSMAPKGISIRV